MTSCDRYPTRLVSHLAWMTLAVLINAGAGVALAQETDHPPDGTFYHMGIWVEDLDEMLAFLDIVMDLQEVSRVDRATGGERLILEDARGQRIELLSDPENVRPHPEFPLHPTGRIAGIAHIAILVDDVIRLREELTALGYSVLAQAPADFADGWIVSEVSEHRIIFVAGPDAITFELFEVRR